MERPVRTTLEGARAETIYSNFGQRLQTHTSNYAFAVPARVGLDRFFVKIEQLAIAHHDSPFDNHGADVRGLGRINQIRIDIVVRRLIQIIKIDDYQIGALTFLYRPD